MKKFLRIILMTLIYSIFLCSCDINLLDNPNYSRTGSNTEVQTTIENENYSNYVISGEYVNIREEANIDSDLLGILYRNTIITATQFSDEWYKVKLDDSSFGYAYADYISPISDDELNIYKDYQIVSNDFCHGIISVDDDGNYANIYSLPTYESDIIAVFCKNDFIEIFATTKNDWYMLLYNDSVAYISSSLVHILSESEYNNLISTPTYMDYDEENCTSIGSYSTYYYNPESNRSFNLEKAADSLNEMVIKPGCTFNWCRDMGPCGKDEGYLSAIEILNGEYIEGYGGGICQVSSTLCAAIINTESNIEFLERNHHAIPQSYIPEELDATVSYPDCNFIFKNNNSYSILILTNHSDGELNISIYKIE